MRSINRGFVSEILIVLVALVVIKYFLHFDIVNYLEGWFVKGVEWIKHLK